MKKVMLVEDEELILQGIRNIIDWQEIGLEVVHMAHNGCEALEMWKKEKVDIVITDLNMPKMGGLELLAELRKESKKARFIILTGYDDFDYARTAIRLGVENYILKPIDEEQLLSQLKETVKKLDEADRIRNDYVEEKTGWIQFLSGKLSKEEDREFLDLLKSSVKNSVFYAAIMKLNINSMKNIKITDVLVELKKEREHETFMVIHLAADSLLLVWAKDDASEDDALDYFSGLQNRVESACGALSFVTVGPACNSYEELPACYRAAQKQQKYLMIEGYGSCLSEKLMKNRKSKDIVVDNTYLRKLILQKDKEGAMSYLEDLLINNVEDSINIDTLYQVAIKIAVILQEIKEEYKLDASTDLQNLTDIIENIYQVESLYSLKSIFISEIVEIIRHLHEEDSQYTPVVKQIMTEVQQNYKEDMNLKTLAYKYHMNASYLGQIFQKEVGCSFAQYMSNIKNEIAKDLILNTKMKINDIAKEVGYPDTSYFYRKFKQCFGVSPASLREMKKY